jgi:hypothetical protein
MSRIRWVIPCSVLLSLLGCDRQPRGNQQGQPMPVEPPKLVEVNISADDGFGADVVFQLREHKLLADGTQTIRAAGLYKGREVAFDVVLAPTWKKPNAGKDTSLVTGTGSVSYRRVGPESEAFLKMLDDLYRTNVNPKEMRAETTFSAAALKGDPGDLSKGPVMMKLFFETGRNDQYAELYTNIDLSARRVELAEKDEGYRRQVIAALQSK